MISLNEFARFNKALLHPSYPVPVKSLVTLHVLPNLPRLLGRHLPHVPHRAELVRDLVPAVTEIAVGVDLADEVVVAGRAGLLLVLLFPSREW